MTKAAQLKHILFERTYRMNKRYAEAEDEDIQLLLTLPLCELEDIIKSAGYWEEYARYERRREATDGNEV